MNSTEDKIANPLNYYNTPEDVAKDDDLSLEDKIKLLSNWLDDINLRLTAEAENMQAPDESPTHIKEVEDLLHKYQLERRG